MMQKKRRVLGAGVASAQRCAFCGLGRHAKMIVQKTSHNSFKPTFQSFLTTFFFPAAQSSGRSVALLVMIYTAHVLFSPLHLRDERVRLD